MSKRNHQTPLNGGEKIVEFYLDSGELVHVTPLSFHIMAALRNKAEQVFPYPDKAEYAKPVDPERSVFADTVIPAEQNPEWRLRVRDVDRDRNLWIHDQIITLAAEFPAGREALIAKYAPELERMAAVIDLPEDRWEATLKFCLLRTDQDSANIVNAARNQLLLTEGEVRDGVRLFRPVLQPNGHSGLAGQQGTQGATEGAAVQSQHADE